MRPFAYARPDSANEAMRMHASSPDAQFLAGGTNLSDLMKLGVAQPGLLVDLADVTPAAITRTPSGGLLIGAGVTNAELAASLEVRHAFPALAQAVLAGASGQIRNAATVGGNLLQRTRCTYFQDVTRACNKRQPGTGCPAIAGSHRDLGVIGTSEHCVATHPSDMAVALAALDATVQIQSAGGQSSTRPLDALYRLPGEEPDRDTTLERGDLITGVEIPSSTFATSGYRKVRERASYAFALVSVAAGLTVGESGIEQIRLAYGGLAPRPWRARTAEADLEGIHLSPEAVKNALRAEFRAARPLPENAFKLDLAISLTVGFLGELARTQQDEAS